MFGRPIHGSDLSRRAGAPPAGPADAPLAGSRRRNATPSSLRRWIFPVASVLVLGLLFVAAPTIAGVILVFSVIAALLYMPVRASITANNSRPSGHANTLLSYWTQDRTGPRVRRPNAGDMAERAAQLEEAAERFKLAGDAETAASFAAQAAELRRYNA